MVLSNNFYKVISLLLAVLLWFYVSAEKNIFTEKTITVDINYENLNPSLNVLGEEQSVEIKIRGYKSEINSFKISDFKAIVDLTSASKGENDLPVKILSPIGVEVKDVAPENVNVVVDETMEKQIPVFVDLAGKTAEGYSSFDPDINPSHVMIKGPKSIVDKLVGTVAEANLNDSKENLSLRVPLKIKDELGNVYEGNNVEISPKLADIFIPVIEDTPSKTVPIRAVLKGSPEYGYKVSRIIIEPEIIKISGDSEKLDEIGYIYTRPIDVTGLNKDSVQEIELSIPKGITSIYEEKAKVVVRLEKNVIEKSVQTEIEIRNLPEGVEIEPDAKTVKITLKGEEINFIDFMDKDVNAFIDAKDYSEENDEFEIMVNKPRKLDVVKVNPAKIKLESKDGAINSED